MTQRITDERLATLREAAIACPDWIEFESEELCDLVTDLRDERAKVAECKGQLAKLIASTQNLVDNWCPDVHQSDAKAAAQGALAESRALLAKLSGDVKK